ncbi:HAD-IIIC family phosphatase [Flavobacterium sp.]|uniref:HAD-IIIC family phosphatase n=1 Tax=Flavobacterium sp. TaxID=239 RepID=UPI00374D5837
MKRLIVDLDDTVSITIKGDYINSSPVPEIIAKLKEYKEDGFEIVINSSRNMRTYESNLGKINIYTLPNIIDWLRKHDVPFDEVYVGKPWCGFDGFYIDDKSIRPSEFLKYSYNEIQDILKQEKEKIKPPCS